MAQTARNQPGEQLGLWLGRGWRVLQRSRNRVVGWLVGRGFSKEIANALTLGSVALAILVLLNVGLISALGALIVGACVLMLNSDLRKAREPEWRDGPMGFGMYDSNDIRIDTHEHRGEH